MSLAVSAMVRCPVTCVMNFLKSADKRLSGRFLSTETRHSLSLQSQRWAPKSDSPLRLVGPPQSGHRG